MGVDGLVTSGAAAALRPTQRRGCAGRTQDLGLARPWEAHA